MSRVGDAARRRWRSLRAGNPAWVLAVCAALFLYGSYTFFDERGPKGGWNGAISGDGRYHWAIVTSLVLDRDLDFENQYADPRCGNFSSYGPTETGRMANPFPIGPALVWAPFFLVGHGVATLVDPDDAAGGNSQTTQAITLYASFLCAAGAGLLAYVMARKRWGPGPALAGAFTGLLCGPVLHYALNQPAFAHAPSAFAVALLWYTWDAGRGQRTTRGWALLGASLGFAMLCRAQNLVFALPLVAEGMWRLVGAWRAAPPAAKDRARALLRAAAAPALGAACALLVFAPQMIAWHSIYGYWLGVPQGDVYMRFGESLWANTLFSSRSGLFPYAPLWVIAMLGLIAVTRRDRGLGWALAVTFFATAFVNGAIVNWWAIGSVGGRRYDGMVIHASLGMAAVCAALLRGVEKRPHVAVGVFVAAVLALAGKCNSVQITDWHDKERFSEHERRNMLDYYNNLLTRATRYVYKKVGNPLSLPGSIPFHFRTGASLQDYDLVVGPYFLSGFDETLDDFQRRPRKEHDELKFGAPGHQGFLGDGFAEVRKNADKNPIGRIARGGSARILIPLNNVGGASMRLQMTPSAFTTIRLLWNGRQVAAVDGRPGHDLGIPFELDDDDVERGVNILDVRHDGVTDGQEAALYTKLLMTSRPERR